VHRTWNGRHGPLSEARRACVPPLFARAAHLRAEHIEPHGATRPRLPSGLDGSNSCSQSPFCRVWPTSRIVEPVAPQPTSPCRHSRRSYLAARLSKTPPSIERQPLGRRSPAARFRGLARPRCQTHFFVKPRSRGNHSLAVFGLATDVCGGDERVAPRQPEGNPCARLGKPSGLCL
jgi:hypothetical protein